MTWLITQISPYGKIAIITYNNRRSSTNSTRSHKLWQHNYSFNFGLSIWINKSFCMKWNTTVCKSLQKFQWDRFWTWDQNRCKITTHNIQSFCYMPHKLCSVGRTVYGIWYTHSIKSVSHFVIDFYSCLFRWCSAAAAADIRVFVIVWINFIRSSCFHY